jgi:hypothetical protein
MNQPVFNRVPNYLLMMASATVIILVTDFSIELLYRFFQFIETIAGASARQAGQYIAYGF